MIKYIEKNPTADEYNNLTNNVGWGKRDNKIIEEALKNTLYSYCAYDNNELINQINDEKKIILLDQMNNTNYINFNSADNVFSIILFI